MKATQKKKDLGIFYTPPEVVDMIVGCMGALKKQEDQKQKRWDSHPDKPHQPSVIDPACGEGIFLKRALTHGLTTRDYVFGVDLDPSAINNWESTSLLHEFGGDHEKLQAHFFAQDGLLQLNLSQHKKYHEGKIYWKYLKEEQFDFVLGNPPYGGMGFSSLRGKSTAESINILKQLQQFAVLSYRQSKANMVSTQQTGLWGSATWGNAPWGGSSINIINTSELEKLPIEILFIDRFIQLAKNPHQVKPGGKLAIVLPEGIFANSTLDYVRRYISAHTKVLGIISLPRDTFKATGTNAKTSILLLEKVNTPPGLNYQVFLASLTKNILENSAIITNSFKEWIMTNSTTQIVDEANGLMIRVDKTLADLNSEKPSSRWDPSYWHPKYEKILPQNIKYQNLSEYCAADDIIYRNPPISEYFPQGIRYLLISNTNLTGVNLYIGPERFIKENGSIDVPGSRLQLHDILIARSGASIGNKFCYINQIHEKMSVSGDFAIIRNLRNINSYYVYVYLLTKYCYLYFDKLKNGVGVNHLNADEIRSILIPELKDSIQSHIESEYKRMSEFHDKAMEAKGRGDTEGYEKNIKVAEDMLRELIAKTEAVIRGEREDVV